MTLAQQRKTFGTNHRGLKLVGAMAAGVVLTASATFGALTLQSQNNIEAVRPTQTSISQEWAAPRVLVSNAGIVVRSPEFDVLSAARIAGGKTYDAVRIQTQEQTLFTERVVVGSVASSLRTGPTLEQAAAMDEALFQGGGVFETTIPAWSSTLGTSVISDEQTYVAELDYRSANGIGSVTSVPSTSAPLTPELSAGTSDQVSSHRIGAGLNTWKSVSTTSTPLTPELSAVTSDQVLGHRVGGGLNPWQSSEEDAMSAGRLQVR
ncbi:MAG: hypothetical protein HOH95_08260 [Dehalococcoidia bacterium]|nr:hypothetical protein [Dehalococcoidia bacterium]